MKRFTWRGLVAVLGLGTCIGLVGCGVAGAEGQSTVLPDPRQDEPLVAGPPRTVVFAGGCFWGVQAVFEHVGA